MNFLPSILAAGDNPLNHVVDHAIWVSDSGWWLLSNHMVMLCIAALLVLLVFLPITARYRRDPYAVPTGTRNFFEAILVFLRNDVAKPLLGEKTDLYMPLLWTLFFFIWFTNLLGLLPISVLTGDILKLNHGHGIYGTATANLYVTGALALITYIVVQATGIYNNGIGGHLKHFLGGAPAWLAPVMVPVEVLGMIVKPFALMVRLFANMTAGHTLLAVLTMFVGMGAAAFSSYWAAGILGIPIIIASIAIMCLELFVATLQAYLFMFLTALFISQMLPHGHHDEDHGHASEHGHTAAPANTPGEVALPPGQRTGPAH